MKNNPRPSTWMLLGGGALLFISTFFKWVSVSSFGGSGINTDYAPGLLGIWCLLIGGAVAVLVALQTFAGTKLPANVLGFTWNQLYLTFGVAAFLITFGRQFANNPGIGVTLGWIASGVLVAGAFIELQSESKAPKAPPTSF